MWNYIHTDELYHYGVLGMKWGKRKARGHAGPGKYITKKRQLAGDKRDLEDLNNGKHLSVGLTKKRQAAYDARDKAALEKRIAKTEAELAVEKKARQKKVIAVGAGVASGMIAGRLGGTAVAKLSGGSLVATGVAYATSAYAVGSTVYNAIDK